MSKGELRAFDPCASRCPPPTAPELASAELRGLIFDTADLLYDGTAWRRRLYSLVRQLGVQVGYGDLFRDWDRHYLVDVHCGRRECGEALEAFLRKYGLSWPQVDELEAASRAGRSCLEANVRPLSGVVKTLRELAEMGLVLAAWGDTHYPAAFLVEQFERLSLARCFRAVLSSCEVEATQPAAECYEASLRALALPAWQVLYVGHDSRHLAGARAAGLVTAAFNFQPSADADLYLARFEDLLPYVRDRLIAAPMRRAA
jgi:FMN phosphatase YigB (HAD superfamily)